jgi:putative glutamine amidotransferase
MSTRARPLVLLSPDIEEVTTRRGPVPQLALHRVYAAAVWDAGGLPLVVPTEVRDVEAVAALVAGADGLLLTGGDFDIDPAHFGEARHDKTGPVKPERTRLELLLWRAAEARQLPVLGICGGMQLLNVARGGSLWQDLPSQAPGGVAHTQTGAKSQPGHVVRVPCGSRLFAAVGGSGDADLALEVNSTHHQAVKTVGQGLVATAVAQDGVVEAIEDPVLPFVLGVQWHPESMTEPPWSTAQHGIYRAFVHAARKRPC